MSFKSFAMTATLALLASSASAQIDLSTYSRVGVYSLPSTPTGANLLAREASGVTYNWDHNSLFVVGDGGTSVVEVSLTGQLLGSMTLSGFTNTAVGDPEGITYVGGGKVVLSFERVRNAAQVTYAAGTTASAANMQQVTLGPPGAANNGNEGITYDPLTNAASGNGFIVVKQQTPQGIFQTNVNFNALTATNGSVTANPTDLFNPALMGLTTLSDVQALSTVAGLAGTPDQSHLLVLSAASGRLIEVDRSGTVYGSLLLGTTATQAASFIHEGVTIDGLGNIYIVSEEGGAGGTGSLEFPQLWVYAPAQPIPEPGTMALLTCGLAGLLLRRRSRA